MDFGKLPDNEFPFVDYSLPADPLITKEVLAQSASRTKPELYVGCAKWGRKEWVGMLYPPKTKEANFLDEYVKHFNSIELNAVFYNMPRKEQVAGWRDKALNQRRDFKFFPKFTQSISHRKRLKDADEVTTEYLKNISEFGDTLGPAFLQLSDNFGPKNIDLLRQYLEKLPVDFDVFLEVRHSDWFSDMGARDELFSMMRELGKGSIITDAAGRRDCVHMELTIPGAFVRFVGNGLHPTDYQRIDEWVERLGQWTERGLQKIYFFLHQHDEKDTPILADYTIQKLNERLGTSLERPGLLQLF